MAQLEPVLQAPNGTNVTLEWGERTVTEGYADVARLTVRPYRPGMQVRVNPRIGIDPEVAEWSRSPFWAKWPFDERLKMIQVFVAGEIATYEYDCTGSGRKAYMVTDHFRAESDARRGPLPQLARVRPAVQWKPAEPARRSSRARFEGLDFPGHGAAHRDASVPKARQSLQEDDQESSKP